MGVQGAEKALPAQLTHRLQHIPQLHEAAREAGQELR